MKVRLEINPYLENDEITIKARNYDSNIQSIQEFIERQGTIKNSLVLYQDSTEFYVNLDEILYFETDDRRVVAHTIDNTYTTRSKLFELEVQLPEKFVRISKSCIVNINKIYALTKSFSTCLIEFQHAKKHVYASRRYYQNLKQRLEEMR